MSEPAPNPGAPLQRRMCERCLRPQSACICHWIAPVACAVEVLILQHPLEVANAKGSARLLHLSLQHSRLVGGETFAEADLLALLHAPWDDGKVNDAGEGGAPRTPVLLYPQAAGEFAPGGKPAPLDEALSYQPAHLRLVVLDATWRKSRKMLYLNPLLQALPRLSLTDVPASRYLIRKAHLPHQLSTLEATCLALMQIERETEKFQPLQEAFDGFIGQQLGYRPR